MSDDEILEQFMLSAAPFLHPTELTETFGMSRQGIYKRLNELEEKGMLKSKKVAGTRNWWITDKGREYVTDED